jgi:hypothetical protein
MYRWEPDGSWALGIGTPDRRLRDHSRGFDAHLVAVVEDHTFIDLSIDQLKMDFIGTLRSRTDTRPMVTPDDHRAHTPASPWTEAELADRNVARGSLPRPVL